jgi:hypothetical protein
LSGEERIVKNPLARFRQAGSFIAGLLIGLSIMIPMFAMIVADPGDWPMGWVFGSLIIVALALMLQVGLTARPQRRRTSDPGLGALPVGRVDFSHGQ